MPLEMDMQLLSDGCSRASIISYASHPLLALHWVLAVAGSRVISGYDEETEIAQVTDSF
jgi:hypothetical protein